MKKLLRFVCVALLTGAMVVACGDDEAVTTVGPVVPTAPAPIFGSVSGTVSVEGSGLPGVSVNLVGAASQSATTGSSGGYSFGNVPAGTHGVQIGGAPADVAFVSTASVVTISTSGQTATADFSGNYIRTSSITGSVTAGGQGVVATVTASGAGMLMSVEAVVGSSDTDGDFTLSGLRAGTYHVAISDFGDIDFPVTTRDVTVGVGLSANVSFSAPGVDPISDAFLVITGVTDASDDDDTYSGRLTASVDIERGDARFEKITLYVDGTEVASQSFGLASAPAEDAELAAAQQIPFTLSFDSGEYDETGAVTYPNGDHAIVVGLTVQGSTAEAFSNRMEVEFDNEDGVHVVVSGQTRQPMIGQDGGYWYGGPGAGFDLTAIPVIYSGRSVPSVTLREGFCVGNDAEAVTAAPYAFTPDCGGHEGLVESNSFSIGAAAVQTLNAENEIFSIQLDYAGPGAPVFRPNPNGRQAGWINDEVGLVAKHVTSGSKKNLDGWLFYGAAGAGVGGYAVQLQDGEDIEEALAATASSTPTLPPASKKNDAYCFVASAVDDLGNRSKLPKEDDGCADPDDSMDAVDAMGDEGDDDYVAAVGAMMFSSITAGVDTEAPTLEFTGASAGAGTSDGPDRVAALESEFELQVKDNEGGSGVHGADPVLATLAIRNADGGECRELGDLGEEDKKCKATSEGLIVALPLVRTDGVQGRDDDTGYYEFTALAQDKAGNQSAEISEVALYDVEAPEVQLSTTRSTDFAKDFTLNKVLVATDNLSLRDYTVNLVATGLILDANIPIEFAMGSNTWDEYNAPAPLTRDDVVRGPVELPFVAVQATNAGVPGDVSVIANLKVDIQDQVDGRDPIASQSDPTGITVGADDGFADANFGRTNVKIFAVSHKGGADAAGDGIADSKSSIKLTATAVVVGKIQTVTVTRTAAAGTEDADDPVVTNVTEDDPALGTETVIMQGGEVVTETAEGEFTTTVTTVETLPNPFSSVNFYATDDGGDMLNDATQLRLITSVSAARADVETVTAAGTPTGSATGDRVWTYEVTMSADDYYAIVGGDGEYVGSIVAVGVNENDKGVALASGAEVLNFEER